MYLNEHLGTRIKAKKFDRILNKNIIASISIIAFRIADLTSTHFALLGQGNLENEFNLIVQIFNISSKFLFYTIEIILAFLLVIWYLFSFRNSKIFDLKANNFKQYCLGIIRSKKNRTISFKNLIIVVGKVIPLFIISTSSIYILNNFLVYKANTLKYYYDLYYKIDKIIPFEFTIYGLPSIMFLTILMLMLYKNFIKNKTHYNKELC